MKPFTTLAFIAMSLLVTTGCKSTQADPAQDPPVQEAGAMPDSQQTQDALAADTPDSVIVVNNNSMIKAWMRAVDTGDIEHVRLMISEGVDVNAKNEDGYTALYIASAFMHPEIVKLLIDSGADVNLRTSDNDRPPIFAFTMGADDIEFYDEAKTLSIIKMLIEAKVNVNATDRNGITPLELVGAFGYSTVAEALIAAGANVNARDRMGVTPLLAAAEQHHLKTLEVLVKAGADVNAIPSPESGLQTALLEASYAQTQIADACKRVSGINGAFDCSHLLEDFSPGIRLLLDAGADPNQSTPGGTTPLMYAAKSGYLGG